MSSGWLSGQPIVTMNSALVSILPCFASGFIASSAMKNRKATTCSALNSITLSWPDSHPDDIDLYAEDPLGNIVWYHEREAGFMVLDRDDRGGINNTVTVNGKKLTSPIRQETVSIRGIVAGEYTVNVNHYLATTGVPVPVAVKVEKINPTVEVVSYDTLTLDHTGQEATALRFRVADNGNVLDVNHRDKSLIQLTRSVRRSGAK